MQVARGHSPSCMVEEDPAQQQAGLGGLEDDAKAGFGSPVNSPVSSEGPTGMSCCTFISCYALPLLLRPCAGPCVKGMPDMPDIR